jgi:hypothetical protein
MRFWPVPAKVFVEWRENLIFGCNYWPQHLHPGPGLNHPRLKNTADGQKLLRQNWESISKVL